MHEKSIQQQSHARSTHNVVKFIFRLSSLDESVVHSIYGVELIEFVYEPSIFNTKKDTKKNHTQTLPHNNATHNRSVGRLAYCA